MQPELATVTLNLMDPKARESILPKVAVVIPTVGRTTVPKSVKTMLADQTVDEVVVVADRDGDGVRAALTDVIEDRRVSVVDGPGRGAGWARQRGVERSTAPVVLFLDDDVLPRPGLASDHARHHVDREDLLVMGYMPVGDRYRRAAATARVYGNDYLAASAALDCDPSRIATNFWAGNSSMSRAALARVPLAVPGTPLRRREDQAFGLRCARAGLIGIFDRSLDAEHCFERTLPQFLEIAREQERALAVLRRLYSEYTLEDAGVAPRGFIWSLTVAMNDVPILGSVTRGAVRAGVAVADLAGAGRFEEHGLALLRELVQRQTRTQLGRGRRR